MLRTGQEQRLHNYRHLPTNTARWSNQWCSGQSGLDAAPSIHMHAALDTPTGIKQEEMISVSLMDTGCETTVMPRLPGE